MHFVLVKIPDPVDPVTRGEKYDDPMTDSLQSSGFGVMCGGGTIASNAGIEGCYLDIELTALTSGIEVIASVLQRVGAPKSSTVEEYGPNEFVDALTRKVPAAGAAASGVEPRRR